MEDKLLLRAFEELLDKKLSPIVEKLEDLEDRLDELEDMLDGMDEKLDKTKGK